METNLFFEPAVGGLETLKRQQPLIAMEFIEGRVVTTKALLRMVYINVFRPTNFF